MMNTWYITAALYYNDISKRSTLVINLHKLFWVFAPWYKAPKWVTFYSLMMHSFYSYTYTWSFTHTEEWRTDFILNFVIILLIHTCMILFPCEGMESRFNFKFCHHTAHTHMHDPFPIRKNGEQIWTGVRKLEATILIPGCRVTICINTSCFSLLNNDTPLDFHHTIIHLQLTNPHPCNK